MGNFRREWPLLLSVVTAILFIVFGERWLGDLSNPAWFAFILTWLFGVVLVSAFAVVRHAEALAWKLGEPLGTLILTLAVTGIEVMMIAAVMYSAQGHTALARDAMFAVVMIVLNGMVGLSLVVGGLRYHEQTYNLQGANAFLAVIVPLAVLGLVLPSFTVSTPGPTLSPKQSLFLIIMSVALYGVFLAIQNLRHKDYFIAPASDPPDTPSPSAMPPTHGFHSIPFHACLLAAYLLPLVVLSKQLAAPINHGIHVLHAPPALGGLLVAILILSPESMGAVRAALANELQRSVNILLGSVLATISLTIPAVLVIGFITGQNIVLGLGPVDMILLTLTLGLSTLTFASARTNVLSGAVHLLLFFAYLMLVFEKVVLNPVNQSQIQVAVAALRAGGPAAFPTETVYGLGADASNTSAVKKVFAAKGRPHDHPLIVHVASSTQLTEWVRDVPAAAHVLTKQFWPGPLTLILKRAAGVNDLVTGKQDTVAIRVPSHPLAQALLQAFGGGVVGPSANRFGHVSATTAEHVRQEFGNAVDCVLDGGACDVGIESTIVDLSGTKPALLRPGWITAWQIESALGAPLATPDVNSPRAPGTLEKHYAPLTQLMLVEGDLIDELARSFTRQGKRVAVLARNSRQPLIEGLVWVAAPQTAAGYAHDLYANLRDLDAAGCGVMLVEKLPLAIEWTAVLDRLARAAAGAGAEKGD